MRRFLRTPRGCNHPLSLLRGTGPLEFGFSSPTKNDKVREARRWGEAFFLETAAVPVGACMHACMQMNGEETLPRNVLLFAGFEKGHVGALRGVSFLFTGTEGASLQVSYFCAVKFRLPSRRR